MSDVLKKDATIFNDGGPAFPVHSALEAAQGYEGMSLRDWFAGQALASHAYHTSIPPDDEGYAAEVASLCYLVADAMLAARQQKKGE